MKTLHYVIGGLDKGNLDNGLNLLKEFLELFPNSQRIETSYNPKTFTRRGFGLHIHKHEDYHNQDFSIRTYRKFEERKIGRENKSIVSYLELLVFGQEETLDRKKVDIDGLLSRYNADGNLSIELKTYPSVRQQP